MSRLYTTRFLLYSFFLLLCFCGVPLRGPILKALDRSDIKGAVDAAKNDSRSSNFLARELLKRGADDASLKETLYTILRGSGREMLPVFDALKNHKADEIRAVSLMKLHLLGKGGAIASLEPYLDSDLGLARAAAVEAFLKEDRNEGFYKKFIVDPEVEVRMKVVQGLAGKDTPWAGEMLYDAAQKDPEDSVREAAIGALNPKNERHLELLKNVVEEGEASLTIAALTAAAKDPASVSLPWLEKFITPPVAMEGIHYAAALLKYDGTLKAASDYLEEVLACTSPTLRQKLINAMNIHASSINGISKLADDSNPDVRFAWTIYARKMNMSPEKRVKVLFKLSERKDDIVLRVLVALSEEKNVDYAKIRNLIWHAFKKGEKKDRKYLLSFIGRSITDAPITFEAMVSNDPEIRLLGAASYLRH